MSKQTGGTRGFRDSLPPSYRDRFEAAAVEAHAQLALARGAAPCKLGLFEDPKTGQALVVVAQDRPGILALATHALTAEGVDIADAEFYTRARAAEEGGEREALAVYWPQVGADGTGRLTPERVECISARLSALLAGAVESLPPAVEAPLPERAGGQETTVRFVDGSDGHLSVLEVETADRSGLLLGLARALFARRVQIVRSEVRTVGSRVLDRFTIQEPDGSSVSPARRFEIQVAVLTAIEPGSGTR